MAINILNDVDNQIMVSKFQDKGGGGGVRLDLSWQDTSAYHFS